MHNDSRYIVRDGEARPLAERTVEDTAESYGYDWIIFDATDEADAELQDAEWRNGNHPDQDVLAALAQAIRDGTVNIDAA